MELIYSINFVRCRTEELTYVSDEPRLLYNQLLHGTRHNIVFLTYTSTFCENLNHRQLCLPVNLSTSLLAPPVVHEEKNKSGEGIHSVLQFNTFEIESIVPQKQLVFSCSWPLPCFHGLQEHMGLPTCLSLPVSAGIVQMERWSVCKHFIP